MSSDKKSDSDALSEYQERCAKLWRIPAECKLCKHLFGLTYETIECPNCKAVFNGQASLQYYWSVVDAVLEPLQVEVEPKPKSPVKSAPAVQGFTDLNATANPGYGGPE